jgi:hypothetical protein
MTPQIPHIVSKTPLVWDVLYYANFLQYARYVFRAKELAGRQTEIGVTIEPPRGMLAEACI